MTPTLGGVKDICNALPTGDASSVSWGAAQARISAADTYQLYAYLRLRDCPVGFFVVPFWDSRPDAPLANLDTDFEFTRSPLDGESPTTAFVLALNMALKPIDVFNSATKILRQRVAFAAPEQFGWPAGTAPG